MVLRGVGACSIARLLRTAREFEDTSDWLLHGPTDPEVVEDDEARETVRLLAAE